jgi:AcrR family transcriptional regulator
MRTVRPRRREHAASRRKLTREDWMRAALEAMRAGGLSAVAIEPLASTLGATKGSFYWHFHDRDELVAASLGWWRADTETVLAHVEELPGRPDRLAGLVQTCFAPESRRVLLAMLCAAEHPLVAPVLASMLEDRIAFTARVFATGATPDQQDVRHATECWTRWIGSLMLHAAAPDSLAGVSLPTPDEARGYAAALLAVAETT